MNKIKENDLIKIIGGVSVTSSIINAITRGITTIFEIGKSIGTSIRRISTNNLCPMK